MRKILKFCFLFILMSIFYVNLVGQANLKIGYNPAIGNFSTINSILNQYQPANSELQKSFGSLHFVHGIQLGVRYRLGASALELGWDNLSRDRNALTYNPNSESFSERSYGFSINSFSLGFDSYFGNIGFGSALLQSKLNINRQINSNDLNLVSESQWALRLQLNWIIQKSSHVSVAIKPYYQFTLAPYDLELFAADLDVSSPLGFSENTGFFGLSFVFYNGKQ